MCFLTVVTETADKGDYRTLDVSLPQVSPLAALPYLCFLQTPASNSASFS